MKKALLVAIIGLALTGFGCATEPEGLVPTATDGTMLKPAETVEGAWFLTFDLPNGWVMVPQYNEGGDTAPTAKAVTNQMTDVIIQSTDAIIDRDGQNAKEGAVTENFLYTHVFRMDKRTGTPSDADDMGDGFFRLMKGSTATYYYRGDLANYKFVVYWNNRELSEVEEVITSVKEVTNFKQ